MNDILAQVEGVTGLGKGQIFKYGLVGGVLLVLLGIGNVFITTLLGLAYPAFMSFVALETEQKEDDKQWLTYWVCYGVFSLIDQFAGIILQFIPFYYFLKLAFLVWLFHPSSMGALWIYRNYVSSFVQVYRAKVNSIVDESINELRENLGKE